MDRVHHRGVGCNACGSPVHGNRYKCGNCPNYDLCSACYPAVVNQHMQGLHAFIELRRPLMQPYTLTALLPPLYTGATNVTIEELEEEMFRRLMAGGELRAD